jgi:hypothetical protein
MMIYLSVLLAPVLLTAPTSSTWLADLSEAKQLARKTGKPIFVVFRCEH